MCSGLLNKRWPDDSSTHWRCSTRWWILICFYTLTYRWWSTILCSNWCPIFWRNSFWFIWSSGSIEWFNLFFTWTSKSTILSHWWPLCSWSKFIWCWRRVSFHRCRCCSHIFFHFLRNTFFYLLLNFLLHFCHKFGFELFYLSFDLCLHLVRNCFLNQSLHFRWDVFKLICHFIIFWFYFIDMLL